MDCTCKACNGVDTQQDMGYGYEVIAQPVKEEVQTTSVFDQLEDVLTLIKAGLTEQAEVKLIKILREVDHIDGQLNEIQKRYAKRGDGAEARELGKVSQRLF